MIDKENISFLEKVQRNSNCEGNEINEIFSALCYTPTALHT
jgi:hypothetical protein